MIKLTLQGYWQPEDDADATIDKWIAEENAKIPADIRENLRGFFPQIGLSSDEADCIPASVAQYITTHSQTYQTYMRDQKKHTVIEPAFFERLQVLYILLDFYANFVETVQLAKRADAFYVNAASTKVKPDALKKELDLCPKTKEEERMLALLVEIEYALRRFEQIVPVNIAKYIDYDSYEIPSDTRATYRAVKELTELPDLRKQAEALFYTHGYVRTGKNSFAPKGGEK